MDLDRAHAILGVDASTPLSDVRSAYLARAKLLHPDRYHGNDQLHGEADRAMADLNAAWDAIQAAGENRSTSPSATSAADGPEEAPRLPYPGECNLCGAVPAGEVSLRRVTGMLLFWRTARLEAELCRMCATVMFRETQAHNMTAGWWGVVAPLANIYALLSNLGQNSAVNKWPMPESRDPSVMTPLPGPPPFSRPVSSRPGPWFGTIAALAVALFVIGGMASSADSSGSTSPDTAIGTCLEFDGTTVSCSDSDAYWKLVSRGPDCSTAPAAFTDPATDRVYCAVRN
ncbi:MAG: J domain-containing protein [Guyparkeria sp.]